MFKTVLIVSTLSSVLAAQSCADGIAAGMKCTADYISKGSGDCAADPCGADDFKTSYGSKCCKAASKCKYASTDDYKGTTKITVPCSYKKGGEGDYILCPVGKYTYPDKSYNAVCSDSAKVPDCDSKSTGMDKLTAICTYSKSYDTPDLTCAKDMYYWGSARSCENRPYICALPKDPDTIQIFTGQSYCGPKSTDDDTEKAQWKPEFKGACMDFDTCDQADLAEMLKLAFAAMGDSNSTVVKGLCPISIKMSSTPGKCSANCVGGQSEAGLKQGFKDAGCTAAEESEMTQNADKAADAQGLPRTGISDATTTMTSLVAASVMVATMVSLF